MSAFNGGVLCMRRTPQQHSNALCCVEIKLYAFIGIHINTVYCVIEISYLMAEYFPYNRAQMVAAYRLYHDPIRNIWGKTGIFLDSSHIN